MYTTFFYFVSSSIVEKYDLLCPESEVISIARVPFVGQWPTRTTCPLSTGQKSNNQCLQILYLIISFISVFYDENVSICALNPVKVILKPSALLGQLRRM